MKALIAMSAWLASVVWVATTVYNMDPHCVPAIIVCSILSFLIFKDTMNTVQAVGPIYWICRDVIPANTPLIGIGFMRQISYPWRVGKGVQVRLPNHTFQIGVSRRQKYLDPEDGLLGAVQGRYLDHEPKDIRSWD